MTFPDYLKLFQTILTNSSPRPPYDNPDYLHYVKLNQSRMNRWLKRGTLSTELLTVISEISEPQHWIIITEPWCGDASQCIPFIQLAAEKNPLITVDYELRDSAPFRINDYLTNGAKAIPKLVIRNKAGNDLGIWGPRPQGAQQIRTDLINSNASPEELKIGLQNWYNEDAGKQVQEEFIHLLKTI